MGSGRSDPLGSSGGGAAIAQQPINLNNDGVNDTVRREIRLHQTDPVISRIVLVSGVDDTGFLSIATKTPNDMFGWYVSPIGDFDADGFEDLAVTAPASLIADGLGPNDPGGPIPAWRGRVDLISGANGSVLGTLFNPEATADSIFGLGAAPAPDHDGDGMPELLVAGMRFSPTPTPEDPNAQISIRMWWIMSTGTGETIRIGDGTVGALGCEFMMPGESPQQYWESNEAPGGIDILPGIAGDLDGDGDVDDGDAAALIGEWASGVPGVARVGDLNGDSLVGPTDLSILISQMGLPPDLVDAIGLEGEVVAANRTICPWYGCSPGAAPCLYQPGGCRWWWYGHNWGFGSPDDGGGGDGCPGCPNWPPPCTGPCCNNPDPCCANPCACNPCGCYPCRTFGCWTPACEGGWDCTDCHLPYQCDSDGDGWVNAHDCDSTCFTHEPSLCDCESDWYDVHGPTFVGVNQPFFLSRQWWWVTGPDQEWQVQSGSGLLESWSVEPTTPYVFRAVAGSAPGTVQIKFRREYFGKICERTHTVHIVEYEPVTIRYATFIPCEIVKTPLNWLDPLGLVPDFFGGDNRIDSVNGTSLFNAVHLRYRSCHQVTVRVSDHFLNPPDYLPSQVLPFGVTTAFEPSSVAAAANLCGWQANGGPDDSATHPSTLDSHNIKLGRLGHNHIRIHFFLSARDPLVPFEQACALEAQISFFLIQTINPITGNQDSQIIISGRHDRFPSHEIYVSNNGMQTDLLPNHKFDSYSPFGGVLDLCPEENTAPVGATGPIIVNLEH